MKLTPADLTLRHVWLFASQWVDESTDELEDDERAPVVLAAIDHGHDVLVEQSRDHPGLAPEPLDVLLLGGQLLVQDLEGDLSLEHPVVRAVHTRHAPGADELLELVAISQNVTNHQPLPVPALGPG